MTVGRRPGAGRVRQLDQSPLEQKPDLSQLTGRFAPAPGIIDDPAVAAALSEASAAANQVFAAGDPTPANPEPVVEFVPAPLVEGEPVHLTPGETLIYGMVCDLVDAVNAIGAQQQWVTEQVNGFIGEGMAQLKGGGIAGMLKMVTGFGGK